MCKVTNNKVIAIITLFVVAMIGLAAINSYQALQNQTNILQKSIESKSQDLDSTIINSIENSSSQLKITLQDKADIIETQINKEYKGQDKQLEEDIMNPKSSSKLSKILDNNLYSYYSYKKTIGNKCFVANNNLIIWNRSSITDKDELEWSDIIYPTYDSNLSEMAIQKIKSEDNNIIFWQTEYSNMNINEMTYDSLIYSLKNNNYDINELHSYEILIPIYINQDTDIFGNENINSFGNIVPNYRLFVIQRCNIYDLLENYESQINTEISDIHSLSTELNQSSKRNITMMFNYLIIVMAIIIASGLIQNSNIKKK